MAKLDDMLRQVQAMKAKRLPWEDHWRQIERRVSPRGDQFSGRQPGGRRTEWIYDSTATLGLDKFAAAMSAMVCPRDQRWHRLQPRDRRLAGSMTVRRYLDEVDDALMDYRYAAASSFPTQLHETMVGLGSMGTAPLWIDGRDGGGIIYRALHISEAWIDTNADGTVDTVARQLKYTGRQAIQRFTAAALPADVVKAAESEPGRVFNFTHLIAPRREFEPAKGAAANLPIGSWYWLDASNQQIVRESGFYSFPLPVCRYTTAPGEDYGRSVAMMALPDIKMVNEIMKGVVRSVHMALDPPLLLPDDGHMSRMQTKPGALNYGGVNARGEALVRPLQTGGNLAAGFEMLEQVRQTINDAFLVTLFQVLVDGPDRMTATEVLERVREKGVLLAPAAARIESELLGPMIEREIDLLSRQGLLPDMPEELAASGGEIAIEYDNPMSRASKVEQATAFFRTMEAVTPMAQVDPRVLDGFNLPVAARGVAQITGVPAAWLRSDDEIAAQQAERDVQANASALLEALPKVAGAQLDAARAEQVGGGLPVAA